jgi:hypothetical protein
VIGDRHARSFSTPFQIDYDDDDENEDERGTRTMIINGQPPTRRVDRG